MKFSLLLVAFMALANCTLVFCQDEFPPFGFNFNVAALKIMREFKCADPKFYEEPPDGGEAIAIDFKEPVFDPQVDLSIAPVGGHTVEGSTAVEALLTNNAMMSIDVFRPGSILDMRAISKANVYYAANNSEVPYEGVEVYTNRNLTTDSDWITIPAGQCSSSQFDVADSYDLTAGGDYFYQVDTYALARHSKQHDLQKSVHLVSNRLLAKDVDGAQAAQGLAAQAKYSDLAKTDMVVSARCPPEEKDTLKRAKKWATKMAMDGAWYALFSDEAGHPNDWFVHFYHTNDKQPRCYVIDTLIKIAEKLYDEAARNRRIDCVDRLRICNGNTMAYSEVRTDSARTHVIHVCPAGFGMDVDIHADTAGVFDLSMVLFTKTATLPMHRGARRQGAFMLNFLSEDVNGLPMAALLPWEVASRNAETWTYYIQWANLLPNYPPA
ncbi:hypothetical protein BFW01_g1657 [Lasiodiplodia theobromae]|nr:hypothetical protein BFW01_g1657 [Lasiodiplodia theobromae]